MVKLLSLLISVSERSFPSVDSTPLLSIPGLSVMT